MTKRIGTPYVRGNSYPVAMESPVETVRKQLPRGNGEWAGYAHVYTNIQAGCHAIAQHSALRLSDEHVNAMAVLGSGHEETMKYEQARLRMRGFIK